MRKAKIRSNKAWAKRNPEYMKQVHKDRTMLKQLDKENRVLLCQDCGEEINWTKNTLAKRCLECMLERDRQKKRMRRNVRHQISRAQNRSSEDASNENERVQVRAIGGGKPSSA